MPARKPNPNQPGAPFWERTNVQSSQTFNHQNCRLKLRCAVSCPTARGGKARAQSLSPNRREMRVSFPIGHSGTNSVVENGSCHHPGKQDEATAIFSILIKGGLPLRNLDLSRIVDSVDGNQQSNGCHEARDSYPMIPVNRALVIPVGSARQDNHSRDRDQKIPDSGPAINDSLCSFHHLSGRTGAKPIALESILHHPVGRTSSQFANGVVDVFG